MLKIQHFVLIFFVHIPPYNYPIVESFFCLFFQTALTPSVLYMIKTYDPYSYECERLRSSNN